MPMHVDVEADSQTIQKTFFKMGLGHHVIVMTTSTTVHIRHLPFKLHYTPQKKRSSNSNLDAEVFTPIKLTSHYKGSRKIIFLIPKPQAVKKPGMTAPWCFF
jgi:hypothetical protein